SGLRDVERDIANLVTSEPLRAAELYETFIAGCNLKAEEVDDSNGEHGGFAGGLFRGWIRARRAGGCHRGETARVLLSWMDKDEYGFTNDLDREAVKCWIALDWRASSGRCGRALRRHGM